MTGPAGRRPRPYGWVVTAPLPVYRVDGWPGHLSYMSGGMFRADEFEDPVDASREAIHSDGERSVSVTSRRGRATELRSEWHSFGPDLRVRPSEWRPVRIPVDGQDRDFDLASEGPWWVAVADIDDVAVMVRAHQVEVSEVRLVEVDRTLVRPMRKMPRPSPRSRVFPAQFDPPPGPGNVDITLRNGRVFTGVVGARPVEVVLTGRWTPSVRGRIGADAVAAAVTHAAGYTLTGTLGPSALSIAGEFRRGEDHFFDVADLSGHVGSDAFRASVERADGRDPNRTIYADGAVGGVGFELWATISDNRWEGLARGTVGGRPVALTATHLTHNHLRLEGSYHGPDVLLMLIAGALAYFM